ncbi:DUF664 domain-containing protein [Mangrovivirga sp. M17]|uniref:DUF664 domain-containing protein n=1 Tax=Mangrovivirga halotolerans TaxID=2993936 RepID=A0ABT3RSB4_9BACT|nr:DinB family protein [Mangrovivirga halotolerans]MCX2744142.1 DUF664 domain-containing protein [Mangrovivirga halotolerans]
MKKTDQSNGRRNFLLQSAALTSGIAGIPFTSLLAKSEPMINDSELNIIGPKPGFTRQIGTLYSMMKWMREVVLNSINGLTIDELDYQIDEQSNSIGAMLYHLAATERYYQLNTFENLKWGSWDQSIKEKWDIGMNLGDTGREKIKGNDLQFYLDMLNETRQTTIDEFRKRDDGWLFTRDQDWPWGPTNNYCKWFHVCEHESNHNGQIKWIRKRIKS